ANNTFVANGGGMDFKGAASMSGINIRNNIITGELNNNFGSPFIGISVVPTSSTISNNIYNSSTQRWSEAGTTYTTYATWAGTSRETSSGMVSPLLVNAGSVLPQLWGTTTTIDPQTVKTQARDFSIQSTSPAVDAGTTLTAVPNDFAGNPRPAGKGYDRGA